MPRAVVAAMVVAVVAAVVAAVMTQLAGHHPPTTEAQGRGCLTRTRASQRHWEGRPHVRGVKAAAVRGFRAVPLAANMPVICASPTQSAPPVTPSQLIDPRVPPVGGRPFHALWGWLAYRCCGDQCGGRHDGHARETCVLWLWGGQSTKQPNQLWNLSKHGYGSSYCYYHNSTADNGGRGGGTRRPLLPASQRLALPQVLSEPRRKDAPPA